LARINPPRINKLSIRRADPGRVRPRTPAFTSELFHAVTHASPEAVWNALTATGSPVGYLFGMTVESDWQPGSRVTMSVTDEWRIIGEVLAAAAPGMLAYTLGDEPGEASVYVKWELRAANGVTFIRLYVDEPWSPDGADSLEAAWLPVLSGLVAHLDQAAVQQPEEEG
jgi:uncharacterized protein YndB with AHSA1/START domain